MAHNLGVHVIATVSTEEKASLARAAGADDVILYTQTDFEAETKRLIAEKLIAEKTAAAKASTCCTTPWARQRFKKG